MVDAFFFFSFKRYQHDVTAIVKYYLCVSKRRDFSKHPLPPPLQKGRTKLAVSTIPLITASSYNCIYVDSKNSESGLHK